jgi:hypothetical protein
MGLTRRGVERSPGDDGAITLHISISQNLDEEGRRRVPLRMAHRPFCLTSLVALAVIACLVSCNGDSPTAPPAEGLTGRWSGRLSLRGALTEAMTVTLELRQVGEYVTGGMTDSSGDKWTVDGTAGFLAAQHVPSTSTCSSVSLMVESSREQGGRTIELYGSTSGRCYGTVMGQFQLRRQ